ncbi:LAFE_0C08218g1_1 [Lachancea fermentati]|uniref:LAFE_0C08218g1_1 n=1 Tax=Lachancea fermentati TaxID=4955 RepID=A0A1G4M9W5_LACFM|nr:LAFE_0C08218g1_1 [Lachancea fermentati]
MTQVDSGSDSAETLKLAGGAGADGLSHCVGQLNIYDLISNQSDGTETETADADADAARGAAPLRRLKSSLKLSSSGSSTSHSGAAKNVRFAQQLTKIKRFDASREPISISCDNSPRLTPLIALDSCVSDDDDEFWFGTALSRMKLPLSHAALRAGAAGPLRAAGALLGDSDSDTDRCADDDDDDDDDDSDGDAADIDNGNVHIHRHDPSDADFGALFARPRALGARFSVARWDLVSTNIAPLVARRALDLEALVLAYLQGNNIKLSSVSPCLDSSKLQGLIYVANLNFEKFIEVKYTFNNWRDIHYVTAQYHRTVTAGIDEFRFTVNLNGLKFFMQMKHLLYCGSGPETVCPLTMELCCRYDVNGETYYDNNNYENYQLRLNAVTKPVPRRRRRRSADAAAAGRLPLRRHLSADAITMSATTSTSPTSTSPTPAPAPVPAPAPKSLDHPPVQPAGRHFSKDTDYFNTSPLKHLFRSESALSSLGKPTATNANAASTLAPATNLPEQTVVPVSPTVPMHFFFGYAAAPNYTHKSPSPKPASSRPSSEWTSEGDSASPAQNQSESLSSSVSSSTSSFSPTIHAPRVMKAFSTNDLRASITELQSPEPRHFVSSAPTKDMKRDLSFDESYSDDQQAKTLKLSHNKPMDYNTLLQSYCFYDPAKHSTRSPQPSPWPANFTSASPPVLSQGKGSWIL